MGIYDVLDFVRIIYFGDNYFLKTRGVFMMIKSTVFSNKEAIENIVADLEYCKDLDPKVWGETVFMSDGNDIFLRMSIQQSWEKPFIPRPTFAEVWAKLPITIKDKPPHKDLKCSISFGLEMKPYFYKDNPKKYYACGYYNYGDFAIEIVREKPVNAALKLYKWCKENGYL